LSKRLSKITAEQGLHESVELIHELPIPAKRLRKAFWSLGENFGRCASPNGAFANPDGSYVLVLTNSAEDREVKCRFRNRSLALKLPRNSVVTLQWS
jgi:hypothetical protein